MSNVWKVLGLNLSDLPALEVPLRPAADYVREGIVQATDETEKMEIAGRKAKVKSEANGKARCYILTNSGKPVGPYILPSEVIK